MEKKTKTKNYWLSFTNHRVDYGNKIFFGQLLLLAAIRIRSTGISGREHFVPRPHHPGTMALTAMNSIQNANELN